MASNRAGLHVQPGYTSKQFNFNAAQQGASGQSATAGIHIRSGTTADALSLQALLCQLDCETPYLGFMPGERSLQSWETQRLVLEDASGSHGTILLACHGKDVIGYLQAQINPLYRYRHILTIEVGIRQAFTGNGLSNRLFATLETWARERQLRRLELTVAMQNRRAQALYLKCGFRVEGTRPEAMLVDGHYVGELAMSKLLNSV